MSRRPIFRSQLPHRPFEIIPHDRSKFSPKSRGGRGQCSFWLRCLDRPDYDCINKNGRRFALCSDHIASSPIWGRLFEFDHECIACSDDADLDAALRLASENSFVEQPGETTGA